jgi:hypothetical protein
MTPNSRDWKSEQGGVAIVKHMEDHAPNLSKQVVYSLQAPPTGKPGPNCSPATGPLRPQPAVSIGSFMPLDSLVYHSMAWNAHRNGWGELYVRPALRQRLNANFVDSLMGVPVGWTSARARIGSEQMEIWLSRCRERLDSLR